MRARIAAVASSLVIGVASCASEPPASSDGAGLPREALAEPSGNGIAYFEGTVDRTRGVMDIVVRSRTGEIRSQASLPYGAASGHVYFHTCSTGYDARAHRLTGAVQPVNGLSKRVHGMKAVIDSIVPIGVTLASGPDAGKSHGVIAEYGVVDRNAPDCASSQPWVFQNLPTDPSFTFRGHAEGTVACALFANPTLNTTNPFGEPIAIDYAMAGGGGGAGCNAGGGGARDGATVTGSFVLPAGATVTAYVGGGGGYGACCDDGGGGAGGSGWYGGGGGDAGKYAHVPPWWFPVSFGSGGGGGSSALLVDGVAVAFASGGDGGGGLHGGPAGGGGSDRGGSGCSPLPCSRDGAFRVGGLGEPGACDGGRAEDAVTAWCPPCDDGIWDKCHGCSEEPSLSLSAGAAGSSAYSSGSPGAVILTYWSPTAACSM